MSEKLGILPRTLQIITENKYYFIIAGDALTLPPHPETPWLCEIARIQRRIAKNFVKYISSKRVFTKERD